MKTIKDGLPKKLLLCKPKSIFHFFTYKKIKPYTMLNYEAVYQVYEFIKDLDRKNVKGAIVEAGCWRGGLGAFISKTSDREVWLFDSFEGLPALTKEDTNLAKKRNLPIGKAVEYIKAQEEDAMDIAKKFNAHPHIIKGWFDKTLPSHKEKIGGIALLRLDGDTYESTKIILDTLYDSVVSGGYIIIDDYHNFDGCRKALYEFFVRRNISPDLREYYPHGRPFFKVRIK